MYVSIYEAELEKLTFRRGGIRFVRIGRLFVSFGVSRAVNY